MQIRKLVKSGHSSLVVAVPRDWIKRNKLKPGDLLYISEDLNKLTVATELKQPPEKRKEIVINIDNKDKGTIIHEITTAYMNNYFLMIIKGRELSKVKKIVKKCISDLVALELMESTSERIVARNFLNLYDVDLKLVIRRIDNIIRSMLTETKEVVKDSKMVQSVFGRDDEVGRLRFLCLKILKAAYIDRKILKALNLEELDTLRYWELTVHLERIGDRIKDIAEHLPQMDLKRRKRFIEVFQRIEKFYQDAMKSFYNFSFSQADTLTKRKSRILQDIEAFIRYANCPVCSEISQHAFDMVANTNYINKIVMYLD